MRKMSLWTALITPFYKNKIDEESFKNIIELQIKNGVDGVVICGTTGESPTLDHDEHKFLVDLAVKTVNRRIKVIAGTGSNSTKEAIDLTRSAEESGADYALICSPYYNKPNQEGIYQHFKKINDETDIPIMVYNIPGRCVIDIADDTVIALSMLKNIFGIKDATGNLARVANLLSLLDGRNFSLMSGEDVTSVGFNAMGGNGVISVTSNIVPNLCSRLQKICESGNYEDALKLQNKLTKLHNAMFCNTNPIPAKYAAFSLGLIKSPEVRLPLAELSEDQKFIVNQAIKFTKGLFKEDEWS